MDNKKRYAVGYYNEEERRNNPEWMKNAGNRLMAYIYDEEKIFNIRYKCSDKEGNRTWFIIEPKELNKAKECFSHEDTTEVIELIDLCNDYDKWKTSCECCNSISINIIPYTYREHYGCVGRAYNCAFCSALKNRVAYKVAEEYRNNGIESAIDLLIAINKDEYKDEEEKYYCKCCEHDLRMVGLIENGEYILTKSHEGKLIKLTIDEYNKQEEKQMQEIEGYYPNFYPTESVYKADKVSGYACFECSTEVEEDLAREIIGL